MEVCFSSKMRQTPDQVQQKGRLLPIQQGAVKFQSAPQTVFLQSSVCLCVSRGILSVITLKWRLLTLRWHTPKTSDIMKHMSWNVCVLDCDQQWQLTVSPFRDATLRRRHPTLSDPQCYNCLQVILHNCLSVPAAPCVSFFLFSAIIFLLVTFIVLCMHPAYHTEVICIV